MKSFVVFVYSTCGSYIACMNIMSFISFVLHSSIRFRFRCGAAGVCDRMLHGYFHRGHAWDAMQCAEVCARGKL